MLSRHRGDSKLSATKEEHTSKQNKMHVLVINDDGPPSPTSSPYVHPFIRSLEAAGHKVTVCLPDKQRSWIAKAHMIGETVKPTYYRPPATFDPRPSAADQQQGTVHSRPAISKDVEEWILLDGTPASCAQIGLHHFLTEERGPVELVVSGPNYGRNTTAVFALSSGTLGGALEAAVCNTKAIALSFAFFDRNHDPKVIDQACGLSVRVIEKLYESWPTDGSVDLYSVNVPLIPGVDTRKVLFTEMLSNRWAGAGACFEEVDSGVGDEDEEESRIRESEGSAGLEEGSGAETKGRYTHRHFKWKPRFKDVYDSVAAGSDKSDGWVVQDKHTRYDPFLISLRPKRQNNRELTLNTV
jgi:tubulin---tyrosine ligase